MKRYNTPTASVLYIHTERLLQDSIKVDSTNKVDNMEDIGFVKEDAGRDGGIWDNNWND